MKSFKEFTNPKSFEELHQNLKQAKKQEYNFDFDNLKALDGKWEWEQIKANQTPKTPTEKKKSPVNESEKE